MGAALRIPFARAEDWRAALADFRSRGFRVVALTPSEDAVDISGLAALRDHERVLVMVGAEGPGLDPVSLDDADIRARIPIDAAVDSLNVVVAAGIALDRLRDQLAPKTPSQGRLATLRCIKCGYLRPSLYLMLWMAASWNGDVANVSRLLGSSSSP